MSKETQVLELAQKGLHLVPWHNRQAVIRKPLWAQWNGPQAPSLESIVEALRIFNTADWAVVPRGFMVLDLDRKNGHDGVRIVEEWAIEAGIVWSPMITDCAIVDTFSKGRHIWFKYSGALRSINCGNGVEFKHWNQSVHIPPSAGYSWARPLHEISSLPELPEFLIKHWQDSSTQHNEEKRYKAPIFADGTRHDSMVSLAAKLKDIAFSEDEIFATLRTINITRCNGGLIESELSSITKSVGLYTASDVQGLALAGDPLAQSIVKFIDAHSFVPDRDDDIVIEPDKLDIQALTHPTNLIGRWVDVVDYNNPMNQPLFGLCSAIAGIGALMGRKYRYKGAYANNYIMMIGVTSAGKQAPLQTTGAILKAVGCEHLIGASDFASGEGVLEQIAIKPEVVWVVDEIAPLLRGIAHPKAAPHFITLNKQLLQLYSGGSQAGTAKADGLTRIVERPYPIILSASQPNAFSESITDQFIESGFLGRFVVIKGARTYVGKPEDSYQGSTSNPIVSEEFLDILRPKIGAWNGALAQATNSQSDTVEIQATPDAKKLIWAYADNLGAKRAKFDVEGLEKVGAVMSKNREKVLKMAMIYAFSEADPSVVPLITESAVKWAISLLGLADETIREAMTGMTSNEQDKNVKRVLHIIAGAGSIGINSRLITQATSVMNKRTRTEVIEDLVESNQIIRTIIPNKRGPPTVRYHLAQYQPKELQNAG